jgi:hypothetical protein
LRLARLNLEAEAMPSSAEHALVRHLERAQAQHAERAASPDLAAALDRLARWQARRLRNTYADLSQNSRYAAAISFFGTDLYGPGDFSRRDTDLARVAPIMGKMLPEGVILTVAGAMELSVLSHDLDRALLGRLDSEPLSVERYGAAYRAVGDRPGRLRQIGLIVSVGRSLDRYLGKPLIQSALVAMRGPARLAGLGALQDFLERGFAAFRSMGGADEFLAIVEKRETEVMDAILAGDATPFPDPYA